MCNYDYKENLVQIRDSSVVCYSQFHCRNSFPKNKITAEVRAKSYGGIMSNGAKKRLTKAITVLVAGSRYSSKYNPVTNKQIRHRLSFITLTIPSNINYTAAEVNKKALEPFLRYMRDNKAIKNYVWKAELQQRGQIHYHIVTDSVVHHQKIRDKWNQRLVVAGLIDESKRGAPSTEIKSMKSVKNAATYLRKYLSKKSGEESTEGKIWDCSTTLKCAKYYVVSESVDIYRILERCYSDTSIRSIAEDNFSMLFFKDEDHLRQHFGVYYWQSRAHYRGCLNELLLSM